MNIASLKKRIPHPLRQYLRYLKRFVPPPVRYGKVFRDTYRFLQESQWWSKEKLEEYQLRQLERLLKHAYENVPYYRRVFDERGLKPKHIQDFNDLKRLPFLTKEIIQDNLEDLIAQNYPKSKLKYVTTGGSTGIPMGFYEENGYTEPRERAFIVTQWKWAGYRMGAKVVVLRGDVIKTADKGKYWRYDVVDNQLVLSAYHMTDYNLPGYIQKMREFKPQFIHVYPSALTILARFMKEHNVKPFQSIRAILCGSENLYDTQRKLLEDTYNCRIHSWYGHAEKALLGSECESSHNYHFFPEYGYLELIDKAGNEVTEEDELGEIVGTGFNNYVMPFIRYKTMDMGVYTSSKCSCGRNYPLLKRVEGRLQELIVTGTGRLVSMTAINMHSDVFDNVKQFQFYQDTKGEVIFNVVKKATYTERDTQYIRSELSKKLGDDMKLQIRFVDQIPRTKSGKYRFLIQKLPIEFGD